MSGISCLLGNPEAQAKIRAWYQAQLAKPVPWDRRPIDHGKEILLVRGVALKRLSKHQELGVQTSHDLRRPYGRTTRRSKLENPGSRCLSPLSTK